MCRWHLGYAYAKPNMLPTRRGFTEFFGTSVTHCEGPPSYPAVPLFANETRIGRLGVDVDPFAVWDNFTAAAVQYISNHQSGTRAGTPFFLYFAIDNTHQPVSYPTRFANTTARGPFGDAVAFLDEAVGQILTAAAATNNTLVVFTGDNGELAPPPPPPR